MKKKPVKLPKYQEGSQKLYFQKVDVPPSPQKGMVAERGLATGAAIAGPGKQIGSTIGSAFGPAGSAIGGAIGGTVGFGVGLASGIIKGNEQKRTMNQTIRDAEVRNEAVDYYNTEMATEAGQNQQLLTNTNQMRRYENGTRSLKLPLVELEGGEMVYKAKGATYKKVADFKNAKPHEKGGVKYLGEEGQIVIPKSKRKQVEKITDKGGNIFDTLQFEAIKSNLPIGPTE